MILRVLVITDMRPLMNKFDSTAANRNTGLALSALLTMTFDRKKLTKNIQ